MGLSKDAVIQSLRLQIDTCNEQLAAAQGKKENSSATPRAREGYQRSIESPQTVCKPNTAGLCEAIIGYLPKVVDGATVVLRELGAKWYLSNEFWRSSFQGLAYRASKNMGDKIDPQEC